MIPTVETHLPELLPFIDTLARDYQAGTLNAWEAMDARVKAFFSEEMRRRMDKVIPGWEQMASYGNGITQTHVIAVLTSLLLLPEYQQAAPDQQNMIQWIVLFHDVMKKAQPGQRDHVHGFRSAVIAAVNLHPLGFPTSGQFWQHIEKWVALTGRAITRHPETGQEIQDNRKLSEILAGIDTLFGSSTPAALIVKAVLLHMSITVVQEWPQMAPLTDAEIQRYIDRPLFPLLRMMMLVDNDAWAFFKPERKAQDRAETLAVFERIEQANEQAKNSL